ncbi:MAG: M48 family metallopeptidase [Peptococcaceae bacterium]|jgi:Zn-dependent protease with chaperone function|nr:M48 family metallopeptidase [Peptococcaceae bacterium]MDH7524691.1 M48 family metallopeptidase [Peptococcaceae bacterium]
MVQFKWDYQINAMTMGVEKPLVVLFSGCVDLMNRNELLFIIGHELGHIKSRHVLYHQMAKVIPILGEIIGKATLGVGELFSAGLQLALLHWARMSEFTADRAGLLTCQSIDDAVSAFIKMAGVPLKYYNSLVVEEFIQQSREFEGYDYDTLDRIAKFLVIASQNHPWTVMRSAELLKWMDTSEYLDIISGKPTPGSQAGQQPPLFCVNCGQRINADAQFCAGCGIKIKK